MHRYRWMITVAVVLLVGGFLKSIAVPAGRADVAPEAQTGRFSWPWGNRAVVTAYFPETQFGQLIPVARRVKQATPEAALAELLAGPAPGRPLSAAVPAGTKLRGVQVNGNSAVVDVEGDALPERALRAMAATLGVERLQQKGGAEVRLEQGTRLYYLYQGMPLPVTLPGKNLTPAQALEQLLTAPAPQGVPWVPAGVSVDAFEVKKGMAYVRLRFSPELRALVESGVWNFSPYYMGVVYTLTEFPEIDRVRFEFAGLSPLALKQCRTPLSVPLERPAPENGRAGEGR